MVFNPKSELGFPPLGAFLPSKRSVSPACSRITKPQATCIEFLGEIPPPSNVFISFRTIGGDEAIYACPYCSSAHKELLLFCLPSSLSMLKNTSRECKLSVHVSAPECPRQSLRA